MSAGNENEIGLRVTVEGAADGAAALEKLNAPIKESTVLINENTKATKANAEALAASREVAAASPSQVAYNKDLTDSAAAAMAGGAGAEEEALNAVLIQRQAIESTLAEAAAEEAAGRMASANALKLEAEELALALRYQIQLKLSEEESLALAKLRLSAERQVEVAKAAQAASAKAAAVAEKEQAAAAALHAREQAMQNNLAGRLASAAGGGPLGGVIASASNRGMGLLAVGMGAGAAVAGVVKYMHAVAEAEEEMRKLRQTGEETGEALASAMGTDPQAAMTAATGKVRELEHQIAEIDHKWFGGRLANGFKEMFGISGDTTKVAELGAQAARARDAQQQAGFWLINNLHNQEHVLDALLAQDTERASLLEREAKNALELTTILEKNKKLSPEQLSKLSDQVKINQAKQEELRVAGERHRVEFGAQEEEKKWREQQAKENEEFDRDKEEQAEQARRAAEKADKEAAREAERAEREAEREAERLRKQDEKFIRQRTDAEFEIAIGNAKARNDTEGIAKLEIEKDLRDRILTIEKEFTGEQARQLIQMAEQAAAQKRIEAATNNVRNAVQNKIAKDNQSPDEQANQRRAEQKQDMQMRTEAARQLAREQAEDAKNHAPTKSADDWAARLKQIQKDMGLEDRGKKKGEGDIGNRQRELDKERGGGKGDGRRHDVDIPQAPVLHPEDPAAGGGGGAQADVQPIAQAQQQGIQQLITQIAAILSGGGTTPDLSALQAALSARDASFQEQLDDLASQVQAAGSN